MVKVKRCRFNMYKDEVWLLKLKTDKYVHFKKPKTIMKRLFSICFNILMIFPLGLIACLWDATIEWFRCVSTCSRDIVDDIKMIFPNILDVEE